MKGCIAVGRFALAMAGDVEDVVAIGHKCLSELTHGRRIIAIGAYTQVPDGSHDMIVINGVVLASGDPAAYDAASDKLRPYILNLIEEVELTERPANKEKPYVH